MGCSSTDTYQDLGFLKPRIVDNTLSTLINTNKASNTLCRAHEIMLSITKLSKKILSSYYNLLYQSGACVFLHPLINHCFLCVFNKICLDLGGNMELANVKYPDDPPYISINMSLLTEDTKSRLKTMLDFVIEYHSYRSIIDQIEKDIPELYYLVYEESELQIGEENKKKMKKSIDVFQETIKTCYNVYNLFRLEVHLYCTRNEAMNEIFNKFREKAIELNLSDIYEIAMLNNELAKNECEIQYIAMHSSVAQAKKTIMKLIKEASDKNP